MNKTALKLASIFALFLLAVDSRGDCLISAECSPFYVEYSGTGLKKEELSAYHAAVEGYHLLFSLKDEVDATRKDGKSTYDENASYFSSEFDFKELMKNRKARADSDLKKCTEQVERYKKFWKLCDQ